MQGEARAGAIVIPVTVSKKLLKVFDEMVPCKQRSRTIETLMRKAVVAHKLHNRVPETEVEAMLEWLE